MSNDRVLALLSQVARLSPNRIRPEARLGDLGLGSSIVLNILQSRLSEEFGVALQMSWKTSVRDVLSAVDAAPNGRVDAAPAGASAAPRAAVPAATPSAAPTSAGAGVSIIGVGIDLEDPAALPETGDPFYAAHFTPREIDRSRESANAREHLAGIWSVKEAARKAVSTLMDVPFTSLEVRHDDRGRPSLVVLAPGTDVGMQFHVSITHTKNMAAAVVVATRTL